MRPVRVVDPFGNHWTVRRKWTHQRLRWRGGKGRHAGDVLDGATLVDLDADHPVGAAIVLVVLTVLTAIVLILFVIPALVFAVELLLILLVAAAGLMGRVVLRRPWTIEARKDGAGSVYVWKMPGWRASRDLMRTVTNRIEAIGKPE